MVFLSRFTVQLFAIFLVVGTKVFIFCAMSFRVIDFFTLSAGPIYSTVSPVAINRSVPIKRVPALAVGSPPRSVALSIFFNHVAHIVLVCAKPQMVWVDTARNIARMTNKHPFRNFVFMNFV